MFLRGLTLVFGLVGAVTTSQFPEYSQQYLQRLGGAVGALETVVADFDRSAEMVGLNRENALAQMAGTDFLDSRRTDMTRTFLRYETLRNDLAVLKGQGPFIRAYNLPRFADVQIARSAWDAYQPAIPFDLAGLIFGSFGFVFGAFILGGILRLLVWPFRRILGGSLVR